MRSSQLAAEAGVTVETLRYYERRGLLPEPERSESGYRSYGTEVVRTVRFVKSAQQLGFSLEEIDSLLELAGGGPVNCDAAKRLATEKLAQLEQRIARLTAMSASLHDSSRPANGPQTSASARCSTSSKGATRTGGTTMSDPRPHGLIPSDPGSNLNVQILRVPDCPLVGALRDLVDRCLSRSGLSATIEEIEGPYPSPTLLINGTDVTGRPVTVGPSCRLDSPSEKEILAALSKRDKARETSRRAPVGGDMELTGTGRRHDESRVETAPGTSGGPRALCSWSPVPLSADTGLKGRVDRLLVGNTPAFVMVAVVLGLLNLGPHLPIRATLALDGLAALVGGTWCSLNFWRCRHAHCLVTGAGWLALSLFAFTESVLGHSVIAGYEQLVLLGVLAAALIFEYGWYLTRHTNAIGPGQAHIPKSDMHVPSTMPDLL